MATIFHETKKDGKSHLFYLSDFRVRHQAHDCIVALIKMEIHQDGCFFAPHKSSSGMMSIFGGAAPRPRELLKKLDQNFWLLVMKPFPREETA